MRDRRVKSSDGRVVEARAPDERGGARRPLAPQAIVEKFRDDAARVLGAAAGRRLDDTALALGALPDAGALMALCRS
ncbi:MAG: hypothetical protein HYU25_00800 [Candidatus Rokubacteria bacterium]|nr:hypothetical protein [Candidatus Rokubacteria bacterium]